MKEMLIKIPEELAAKFKSAVPRGERSKVIAKLIEEEIRRRDDKLYKIALELEKNEKLNEEMKDWDITAGDGIE
jgi:metal-responsive CopG/Arc/MetJ family transcriptional regulator